MKYPTTPQMLMAEKHYCQKNSSNMKHVLRLTIYHNEVWQCD